MAKEMTYVIGRTYVDRAGRRYIRHPFWGHLPTFITDDGRLHVRNFNGRYRWDEILTNLDIVGEENAS